MKFSCSLSRTCSTLALSLLAMAFHTQAQEQVAQDDVAHAAQLQQRAAARSQERADIAQARSAIAVRQQAAEKECWQRFAVESCLSKARVAAREEDNALRQRELRLNSEERQEKADERLRAIERKQREKTVPTPVTVTPRDGSGVLSTETRASDAQKRAAEQARRVQQHEAATATQQQTQAQERAAAHSGRLAKALNLPTSHASRVVPFGLFPMAWLPSLGHPSKMCGAMRLAKTRAASAC